LNEPEFKQRLEAILAADVAGYSRLMAADERATVAALDTARSVFRTQIESNQGRVIDMAGDSVLAVFETATGAVSAALAIQGRLKSLGTDVPDDRRMRFRIGVHLGDVIEKADGTVYGDGVNIASRLEGLAEPGGITVSESIRTAVKGKVSARFDDQGAQQVKNIAEPVRAYRVAPEASAVSKPTLAAGEIDLSLPDRPSIAMLPFTNMSGDPEQEYFVDGMVEDIITELARFQRHDPQTLFLLSWTEASAGNVDRAKELAAHAIRMSPKDRQLGTAHLAYAGAAFIDQDLARLREAAELAIQSQPSAPIRRVLMIAYAAEVGDTPLLRTHLEKLQSVAPDFIPSLFRGDYRPFHRPEHMAMLLDSLRKAGLGS
jgi:class 3 adenylate cyclase